jgi:hypothetical protein
MSLNELLQNPPIQGTNLFCQSITVGPQGSSGGSPFDIYSDSTYINTFYFVPGTGGTAGTGATGPSLTPTGGTITITQISDKIFMNIPGSTGTVSVISFATSLNSCPTGYRPTNEAYGNAIGISSSGTFPITFTMSTTGILTFIPAPGIQAFNSTSEIPPQTIMYHL